MQGLMYCHRETTWAVVKSDTTKPSLSIFGIGFARRWHSCHLAGVGCDNTAKLTIAPDRAVAHGPKIDLQHIVTDTPSTMRALGVVMAHPSAEDVVELRPAEADEKIQTFALDGTDEGLSEGVGVRCSVRDLDDPGTFRCPDCIEAGAELGVGVSDEEARFDPLLGAPHKVDFILPGSTATFKKMPLCQRDGARLHFGTLLREGQRRPGRRIVVVKLGLGVRLGPCSPVGLLDRDVAGAFRCSSRLNQMTI